MTGVPLGMDVTVTVHPVVIERACGHQKAVPDYRQDAPPTDPVPTANYGNPKNQRPDRKQSNRQNQPRLSLPTERLCEGRIWVQSVEIVVTMGRQVASKLRVDTLGAESGEDVRYLSRSWGGGAVHAIAWTEVGRGVVPTGYGEILAAGPIATFE